MIEIKPSSRDFIKEWLPGSGAEEYVVSASITAIKPLDAIDLQEEIIQRARTNPLRGGFNGNGSGGGGGNGGGGWSPAKRAQAARQIASGQSC